MNNFIQETDAQDVWIRQEIILQILIIIQLCDTL